MIFVSAGDATEGGLVRPVLCCHVSAGETGPARVSGIDPDQTSSPPRKLIFQKGKERPPSPGQDGAVESGLLPDVPSGRLFRSPGASGHVPDSQILDVEDGLGFADRSRGVKKKKVCPFFRIKPVPFSRKHSSPVRELSMSKSFVTFVPKTFVPFLSENCPIPETRDLFMADCVPPILKRSSDLQGRFDCKIHISWPCIITNRNRNPIIDLICSWMFFYCPLSEKRRKTSAFRTEI